MSEKKPENYHYVLIPSFLWATSTLICDKVSLESTEPLSPYSHRQPCCIIFFQHLFCFESQNPPFNSPGLAMLMVSVNQPCSNKLVRTAAAAYWKNYSRISWSVSMPTDTLETHMASHFGVATVVFGTKKPFFLLNLEEALEAPTGLLNMRVSAPRTPLNTPAVGAHKGLNKLHSTSRAAFSTLSPKDLHQMI